MGRPSVATAPSYVGGPSPKPRRRACSRLRKEIEGGAESAPAVSAPMNRTRVPSDSPAMLGKSSKVRQKSPAAVEIRGVTVIFAPLVGSCAGERSRSGEVEIVRRPSVATAQSYVGDPSPKPRRGACFRLWKDIEDGAELAPAVSAPVDLSRVQPGSSAPVANSPIVRQNSAATVDFWGVTAIFAPLVGSSRAGAVAER